MHDKKNSNDAMNACVTASFILFLVEVGHNAILTAQKHVIRRYNRQTHNDHHR